jgi:excisionase family DNA binding protein
MHSNATNNPKLITIREFCARYAVGRSKAYQLLKERKVEAKKFGSSTLIVAESAEEWMENLPSYAA